MCESRKPEKQENRLCLSKRSCLHQQSGVGHGEKYLRPVFLSLITELLMRISFNRCLHSPMHSFWSRSTLTMTLACWMGDGPMTSKMVLTLRHGQEVVTS